MPLCKRLVEKNQDQNILKMASISSYTSLYSNHEYRTRNSTSDSTMLVDILSSSNMDEMPDNSPVAYTSSMETGRYAESSCTSSCKESFLTRASTLSSSTSQLLSSVDADFTSTTPLTYTNIEPPVDVEVDPLRTCDNVHIHKNKRDQLNFWRLQKRFCDTKVVCQETIFFAHRAVLTHASNFFAHEIELLIKAWLLKTGNISNINNCNSQSVISDRSEKVSVPNDFNSQARNFSVPIVSNSLPERSIDDGQSRQAQVVKISRLTLNNQLPNQFTKHKSLMPVPSPLRTQSDCTGLIDKAKYNATRMPQHGCFECKPYATQETKADVLPTAEMPRTNESQFEDVYPNTDDYDSQARLERCSSSRFLYHDNESLQPSKSLSNTHTQLDVYNCDYVLILKIGFLSPLVLKTLLEFIYTGSLYVLQDIPVNSFDDINDGAVKLGLKDWVDVFEPEIIRQALTMTNFIEVWTLAEERSIEKLQFEVAAFLVKNVACLCNCDLFLELPFKKIEMFLSSMEYYQSLREENLQKLMDSIGLEEKNDTDIVNSQKGTESRSRKRHRADLLSFFCRLPKSASASQDELSILASQSNSHSSEIVVPSAVSSSELDLTSSTTTSSKGSEALVEVKRCPSYSGNKECFDVHPNGSTCPQKLISEALASADRFQYPTLANQHEERSADKPAPRDPLSGNVISCKRELCSQYARFRAPKDQTPGKAIKLNMKSYKEPNDNAPSTVSKENVTGLCLQTSNTMITKSRETSRSDSPLPILMVLGDSQQGELVTIKCNLNDDCWEECARLSLEIANTPALAFLNAFTILLSYTHDETSCRCDYMLVQQSCIIDDDASLMYDLPHYIQSRQHCAAFLIGSSLCVCGGEEFKSGMTCEVEICNLTKKDLKWARMSPMGFKRANHSAVWYNGFVYVLGGNTNRCERFDPDHSQWFEVPPLPSLFNRFQPVTVVVQQRLIAMSCYMPTHIHELNELVGMWHCSKVAGNPPGRVVSVTSWDTCVFTLDDRRSICWFDVKKPAWQMVSQLCYDDFVPLYICVKDPLKKQNIIKTVT